MLEGLLSPEERMLRDAVRKYSQEQLLPRVLRANRHEGTTPPPQPPLLAPNAPLLPCFCSKDGGWEVRTPLPPLPMSHKSP